MDLNSGLNNAHKYAAWDKGGLEYFVSITLVPRCIFLLVIKYVKIYYQ